MWGDLPHPHLPPDSEEELRVVYGDGGGGLAAEAAAEEAAARGGRVSICLQRSVAGVRSGSAIISKGMLVLHHLDRLQ